MQTTIVKWGNSQGIRLPKVFLQNIRLSENDLVDVILENERIVIRKANAIKHKTTKQRLLDFYGPRFNGPQYEQNGIPQKEIDWGKPVGNEIW